jgi:hypothetical protein
MRVNSKVTTSCMSILTMWFQYQNNYVVELYVSFEKPKLMLRIRIIMKNIKHMIIQKVIKLNCNNITSTYYMPQIVPKVYLLNLT